MIINDSDFKSADSTASPSAVESYLLVVCVLQFSGFLQYGGDRCEDRTLRRA